MKANVTNQQLESLRIDARDRPRLRSDRGAGRPLALILTAASAVTVWVAASGWRRPISADPPAESPALTAPSPETSTLTAGGRIASDHVVQVATKVSGQVVELFVEAGQPLRAGQPFARLEVEEYEAMRDIHAARLSEAAADLQRAQHDYERTEALRARQIASDTEWVNADTAFRAARARVAAATAGLALSEKRLRDCEIISPMDGIVLETHVDAGDFVAAEGGRSGTASGTIATIARIDRLRIEVDVSERDIARVAASMPCTIVPDAYPDRRYGGRVLRIDPAGNYGKGTVGVVVRIDQPDEFLRIGGGARVEFSADTKAGR